MASERWERVHIVTDVYDSPVHGVAEFGGAPHLFERQFSKEEDEYTDRYRVMAIDQELFSLMVEAWSIWLRWRVAFDEQRTSLETHPALPEDRERHQQLRQAIGNRDSPDPARSRVVGARFRERSPRQFEVQWLT